MSIPVPTTSVPAPTKQEAEKITLGDFLQKHGQNIAEMVQKTITPVHDIDTAQPLDMSDLVRKPYTAQAHAITAITKSLKECKRYIVLRGEMGCGKSLISVAGSYKYLKGRGGNVLCVVPPHLVNKTQREIAKTVPKDEYNLYVIEKTNNQYLRQVLPIKTNPEQFKDGTKINFWVISRNTAKLDTTKRLGAIVKDFNLHCPVCNEIQKDKSGCNLLYDDVVKGSRVKKIKCSNEKCQTPLWQYDCKGIKRYAIAEFIKRYAPRDFFDVCIFDEVHELKAGDTAQGQAMAALITKSKKVVAMTGTLMGGYAWHIFYLLFRMDPQRFLREGIEYKSVQMFSERYGVIEKTETSYNSEYMHANSLSTNVRTTIKARPGIHPALFKYCVNNTVSIDLEEIANDLPRFEEEAISVEMSPEVSGNYQNMATWFKGAVRQDKRLLGKMLHHLLAYPDRTYGWSEIESDKAGNFKPTNIEITENNPLPKDVETLRIIKKEVALGRRCYVFSMYTQKRNTLEALEKLLHREGIKAVRLDSKTVNPKVRESWIAKKVQEGVQVILGNPACVSVGLDLFDFPTLIFHSTGYNLYTLRQAARRAWRIGQTDDCRVYYIFHKATAQEAAMSLMGKKLEASLTLEGKFSSGGLMALVDMEDDTTALAKALNKQITIDDPRKLWANISQQNNKGKAKAPAPVETVIGPDMGIETTEETAFDSCSGTQLTLFEDIGSSTSKTKKAVAAATLSLF